MIQSVENVCSLRRPIWASLLGFKRGTEKLSGSIGALGQIQGSARDGVKPTKEQFNTDLIEQALLVAGAIFAFGTESGDLQLSEAFDLNTTNFMSLREAMRDDKAQAIHDKGRELLDAEQASPPFLGAPRLADHGLTDASLLPLQSGIAVYGTVFQSPPRNTSINISAATAALKDLFDQGDAVLAKILDKLIVQFQTSAPDFVTKYNAARIIVDSGSRAKVQTPTPPPVTPTKPPVAPA